MRICSSVQSNCIESIVVLTCRFMARKERPSTSDESSPSTYHSPLRVRQAALTRRAILDAGVKLFGERGWAGTTLTAVAAEAGTAVETVYSIFGSKSALLVAATDVAILGDDLEATMDERDNFIAISDGNRAQRLRTAVHVATSSYARSIAVLRALAEASGSDEAALARMVQYEDDRHRLITTALELVLRYPPPVVVVDAVWSLASPESLQKLTEERHWSVEEYEAWIVRMVGAVLRDHAR